ncbi:MAG: MerR family transcriptional regulator [Hyphomonadaceae bacterium]
MTITSQAALPPDSDSVLDDACDEASMSETAKCADAFRTIGEAAAELGLKTHVLRFWETKFDNLRPMKRPDGRRFYRADDMELLRKLQNLLHVQGLTIRGAIKVLDGDTGEQPGAAAGVETEGAEEMMVPAETGASVRELQEAVRDAVERGDFGAASVLTSSSPRARLETLLAGLTDLKSRIDAARTAA